MTRTLEEAKQTVDDARRILLDERERISGALTALLRCKEALDALAKIETEIPVGPGRSAEAIEEMAATIYHAVRAQRLPMIELEREARHEIEAERAP